MHVLLVCCSFVDSEYEAMTGMPKAVLLHAKGLKARGHEVKILSTGRKDRKWMYHEIEIISIGRPVNIIDTSFRIVMGTIERERKFTETIRNINEHWHIDIIQYAGLWGTGLFRPRNIRAVSRISGYAKLQRGVGKGESTVKLLTMLDKIAANKMDVIFCPGNMFAKELGRDIGKEVRVLETPFVEEKIVESDRILKKRLKGKQYVVYFGRISWDKGFHVLSDAAFELLDKCPGLYIVIAGRAAKKNSSFEREILEKAKQYKNRIMFLGMISHAQLFPIIRNSLGVVLPSIVDNFPNTCMEAMNLGSVVVGTFGASFEQLIEDGENGFLANRGDAQSLIEKVMRCISLSDKEREKIVTKARNTIALHDMNSYFCELEELYNSIG